MEISPAAVKTSATIGHESRRRRDWSGYLFLSPAFIFFGVFTFFPIIWTGILSLQNYNVFANQGTFIGFQNFSTALHSTEFMISLRDTLYFTFTTVPISVALALLIATILNWENLKFATILQTFFFIPYIVSSVGVALVWTWLFDTNFGLINTALQVFGIAPVQWLTSSGAAMPALVIVSIWGTIGFPIILFRAGLKAIPVEVQESASIDGASATKVFWKITFPMLAPTTLFVFVISIINAMQVFTIVDVMTQGGPLNATDVIVYYIFKEAFQFFNMGYGSAVAVILFLVILGLTVIQIRGSRRYVYYEGERNE